MDSFFSFKYGKKWSQASCVQAFSKSWGYVQKKKTKNRVANPSTNIFDQSVGSFPSTTLTPEVKIDTATTEAEASTTFDVLSYVPEPANTATTEDSVSTTETAASAILHVLSSVPEQGKQATDNRKPIPISQPFQPIHPKYDSPLRSFSNGKKQKRFNCDWFKNEDWKSWLNYNAEKDAAFCPVV